MIKMEKTKSNGYTYNEHGEGTRFWEEIAAEHGVSDVDLPEKQDSTKACRRQVELRKVARMATCTLTRDKNETNKAGMTVTELTAYLAGEKHSAYPKCASSTWTTALNLINERTADAERQSLKEISVLLVDSLAVQSTEDLRALMIVDYTIRYVLPEFLSAVLPETTNATAAWATVPFRCLPALSSWKDLDRLRPWINGVLEEVRLVAEKLPKSKAHAQILKEVTEKVVEGVREGDTVTIPSVRDMIKERLGFDYPLQNSFAYTLQALEITGMACSDMALSVDLWQLGIVNILDRLVMIADNSNIALDQAQLSKDVIADLIKIISYNLQTGRRDYDKDWDLPGNRSPLSKFEDSNPYVMMPISKEGFTEAAVDEYTKVCSLEHAVDAMLEDIDKPVPSIDIERELADDHDRLRQQAWDIAGHVAATPGRTFFCLPAEIPEEIAQEVKEHFGFVDARAEHFGLAEALAESLIASPEVGKKDKDK